MLKDYEIIQALKAGEQSGMEALFERYYKPLVVFADSYLHNLSGAEDLVQEQIVKLWSKQAFDKIVPEAFSSFLFTVVKNACINWMEKKKISLGSIDMPHFQIALEETEKLDDSVVELIADALAKLPEKTRQVVECVMLKDQMYKEAAEELGVSVNTVKTLLKQGIKELREMLKDKQDFIFFLYLRKEFENQS
ncbi:MAG: sigma-70 family RNA polymerase sigma factor [Odoribacter sp.]